tara:strand:+ start:7094 stop:7612 length:519 start_codon:yes stop_codon:yes gene_type:complete
MAYIGVEPAARYSNLVQQTFSSPTGTSFTLTQAVTSSVDIALFIDNVRQDPTGYTASGTTLTTSTISSPSTMYCLFNGKTVNTINPSDGSVGIAQLSATGTPSAALALKGDNSWGTAGGPSLGADAIIRTNGKAITSDIVFAGTENGMTIGPVTINSGITVTVTSGSTWTIV